MSEVELNRKIEFIVERQAQFSADIQVMREVTAADTRLLKEETKLLKEQQQGLADAVTTVVGLVGDLAQTQAHANSQITGLAEAQVRADERLNILIGTIERYLGGNENRRSEDRP
ncbi:MAG: hypothetical protein M3R68_02630 [Acidobacteriota bacterium]|nr:hypothetical protein [Acidobacteriota bacterium]